MAASAVYQLSHATDDKSIQVMHALAKLGGWCGRTQTPIGSTMLMRGTLLLGRRLNYVGHHDGRDYATFT
jgi:hypothetical protein